ncbi:MAG: hypothetical protein AAGF19_09235, partial [Pseudomonadota bacterium]
MKQAGFVWAVGAVAVLAACAPTGSTPPSADAVSVRSPSPPVHMVPRELGDIPSPAEMVIDSQGASVIRLPVPDGACVTRDAIEASLHGGKALADPALNEALEASPLAEPLDPERSYGSSARTAYTVALCDGFTGDTMLNRDPIYIDVETNPERHPDQSFMTSLAMLGDEPLLRSILERSVVGRARRKIDTIEFVFKGADPRNRHTQYLARIAFTDRPIPVFVHHMTYVLEGRMVSMLQVTQLLKE